MPANEQLYVGNATRQVQKFMYRVSRDAPVWEKTIPPGAQVKIGEDLAPSQVDHIVRQHACYGIVAADTIDQARGFHGMCYSIGKPITQVRLMMLMERNHSALIERGREIREQTAVAQNNMLETALKEQDRPERLMQMDLTIQQENRDADNTVAQMSEGFRVIRGGVDTPSPKIGKSGRRRAA